MGEFFRKSWKLAKRPAFLFLLLSDTLGWISNYIPFVHLYERARLTSVNVNTKT